MLAKLKYPAAKCQLRDDMKNLEKKLKDLGIPVVAGKVKKSDIKMALAKVISMEIAQPWGSNFQEEVEETLHEFGFFTFTDEDLEGSDGSGFWFSKSEADLEKAEKLVEERNQKLGTVDEGDDEAFDTIENEHNEHLNKMKSLHYLGNDWKHWDHELDAKILKKAGLKMVSEPSGKGADEVITVTVSKI